MRLFLLRHAQAEATEPDQSRELTLRGRQDVHKLARKLRKRPVFKPVQIWHSPYVRAVATARLLKSEMGLKAKPEIRPGLTPFDPIEPWLKVCHEIKHPTLIVGHNPHLALLAGRLLGTDTFTVSIDLKKCALLCLERHDEVTGTPESVWTLRWMLVPQLLR